MKLIRTIYQVVTDPLSFDELLVEWDLAIDRSLSVDPSALDDPELADHTVRAAEIIHQLQKAETAPRPLRLSEIIDHDPNPALLLSKEGKILAVNPPAIDQLTISKGQKLTEITEDTFAAPGKVRALLASIAEEQSPPSTSVQADSRSMVGLLELPILTTGRAALFALSKVRCDHDSTVAGLLTSLAPVWSPQTLAALSNYFGLTSAEIEVVKLLAEGQNAGQIAESRETSLHTVRTQIKSILAKTRLDSQLDLVRHLGFLQRYDQTAVPQSEFSLSKSSLKETSSIQQSRRHQLKLQNGRELDYVEVGPPEGRPALYIHGLIDSTVFRADFLYQLSKRNIRLIAPERPGFGTSPPYEKNNKVLDEFSDYARQLLDHLGIKRTAVVGHMAGAVYAIALAGLFPDRVNAIISIAGAVPMIKRWQFSNMSKGHRIAGLTARHFPAALPLLIRGGIRLVLGAHEDRMLDLLFHDADVDRKMAADPEISKLLFDRFHFVVQQGPSAFQTDIVLVSSDWSQRLTKLCCPLALIHGEQDQVVLFKAVKDLAERLPNTSLHRSPNSGQLVLFNEVDLILDQLEPFI